jgi:glycosyltransferase involved in cell wall biosynthesis
MREKRYSPYSGRVIACIPAYNAEKSIRSLVDKTKDYVDEVIVVNDGSLDNTALEAQDGGAKVINHPENLGYGSAISTCLKAGLGDGADIIITLDSDFQHDPSEIPILVKPIIEGNCDIVTGSRFVNERGDKTMPSYRKFGITMLTGITNMMAHTAITDATTGFRAYSNYAARFLTEMKFTSSMGASAQILIEAHRSGLRIKETQVHISYGTGFDKSTQNAVSMGVNILTSILRYITIRRPLTLIGLPGLAVLCMGTVGLFMLLDTFGITRAVPIGLGMFTVGTVVVGVVLLLSSLFLYALSTISKDVLSRARQNVTLKSNRHSIKTSLLRYVSVRKPLTLIGIPGLAILSLGTFGLFMLLDIFSGTRVIPIGLGMFTVGTVIIGLVLLMTSIILHTVSRLIGRYD